MVRIVKWQKMIFLKVFYVFRPAQRTYEVDRNAGGGGAGGCAWAGPGGPVRVQGSGTYRINAFFYHKHFILN